MRKIKIKKDTSEISLEQFAAEVKRYTSFVFDSAGQSKEMSNAVSVRASYNVCSVVPFFSTNIIFRNDTPGAYLSLFRTYRITKEKNAADDTGSGVVFKFYCKEYQFDGSGTTVVSVLAMTD